MANEEPFSMNTIIKDIKKLDENNLSYSMNGVKANKLIREEQVFDLVLMSIRLKKIGQPYYQVLPMSDSCWKQPKANEVRNIKERRPTILEKITEKPVFSSSTKSPNGH